MRFPSARSARVPVTVSVFVVLAAYGWLASFGTLSGLPAITAFYDQLAAAFLHGSLALQEEPDARLLRLANPFDRSQWAGVPVPIDYSLYGDKYYLYFGPVPALLLCIARAAGLSNAGDPHLVVGFALGLFIVQVLFVLRLRERYAGRVGPVALATGIVFLGLIAPYTWVLTRARVYEAASIGAQFFFLLGLSLLEAHDVHARSAWRRSALAGFAWALAIGCKLTIAPAIGAALLMLLLATARTSSPPGAWRRFASPFAAAAMPVIAGLLCLGAYNWARFGSVVESGFSYQLAGPDIQAHRHELFARTYVLPNFYDYVLNRPIVVERFPYLQSPIPAGAAKLGGEVSSMIRYANPVAGFATTTPFFVFALLAFVPRLRSAAWLSGVVDPGSMMQVRPTQRGMPWRELLFIVFAINFAVFLSYFWVETRFCTEFLPYLSLLAVVGYWRGLGLVERRPPWYRAYSVAGIGLAAYSVGIGVTLALADHKNLFRKFNPDLAAALFGH